MKSSRGSRPRSVLVVDDNLKALARTARELSLRGFDVATSGASAGAFQSACELSPAVVVVVMDNATGGGLPLIRLLATHRETRDIPVVVTGCSDESLLLSAQGIGTVVVLQGDCSADTLATALERMIQAEFPVRCPKCAARAGFPQRVSTEPNGGTYVSSRCEECAHEWRAFRQADRPGFPGKD